MTEEQSRICVNCAGPVSPVSEDISELSSEKARSCDLQFEELDLPPLPALVKSVGNSIANSCENVGNQSVSTSTEDGPFEAERNFSSQEIASALQSIYSLNFLNFFDDDPIFESAPMLCLHCQQVLFNLRKYYEEFNNLRKTESHLAQKIRRLSQIIDSQRQSIIKCEVLTEEDNEGEVHLPDASPCAGDEESGDRKVHENLDTHAETGTKPGPWVVLERLKVPECQSTVQGEDTINENYPVDFNEESYEDIVTLDSSSDWSNNCSDDSDYGVPKKKTLKKG